MQLAGRSAIVTGASRGIGLAIARGIARAGCAVTLVARSRDDLEAAAASIRAEGGRAAAVADDLSRSGSAESILAAARASFGAPAVLVNNAGYLGLEIPLREDDPQAGDILDMTMGVNIRGPYLLSRACLGAMIAAGEGYILNISSTVALGTPARIASYGISKHAMVGLSEALRDECVGTGVKVSTIYPGITDTDMVRAIDKGDPGEWMQPEDIAACVLFLLSLGPRVIVKDMVPWAVKRDRI